MEFTTGLRSLRSFLSSFFDWQSWSSQLVSSLLNNHHRKRDLNKSLCRIRCSKILDIHMKVYVFQNKECALMTWLVSFQRFPSFSTKFLSWVLLLTLTWLAVSVEGIIRRCPFLTPALQQSLIRRPQISPFLLSMLHFHCPDVFSSQHTHRTLLRPPMGTANVLFYMPHVHLIQTPSFWL